MTRDSSDVDDLLRAHEARGLQGPAIGRIVFSLYGLFSAVSDSVLVSTLWPVLLLVSAALLINGYFLYIIPRTTRLREVGFAGVGFDALMMACFPVLQYYVIMNASMSPALLAKTPLPLVLVTFIAINSLAMRPIYPALITICGLLVLGGLLVVGFADPRTVYGHQPATILAGPSGGTFLLSHQMGFVLLIGICLTLGAMMARKTMIKGVEAQAARAQEQRVQARLLMEGRVGALGKMVAGISHEINSPLGAVRSNTQTIATALDRLRGALEDDSKATRVLEAASQAVKANDEASERIATTLQTLRTFAHLDEAEIKQTDLNAELDATIALLPSKVVGSTQIRRDYGELSPIKTHGGRLNQAFLTLLTNACEATDDQGQVTIRTRQEGAMLSVEIADTGSGIPAEQLPTLFDVRFSTKRSRAAIGIGMAACQSTVLQHGGEISVSSVVGKGTRFVIGLPTKLDA